MSFFLRAKFTNFPPVRYVIFKVQVWIADDYVMAGMAPSVVEQEMQTPVKPWLSEVSAFDLFFCAIIIPEAAWAVKQTGIPSTVDK